ncbi:MAG: hypothetical protein KGS72_22005 [Cyanobacteria bacterium REEB67]|nr:hypothetical protein [Cyanobacteria bacterium REEB67]
MRSKKVLCTALAVMVINSFNFLSAEAAIDPGERPVTNPSSQATKGSKAVPLVEKYLIDCQLDAGEKAMCNRLQAHPRDDQARFGLAVLQFLRGVEQLFQDLYHYGWRDFSGRSPLSGRWPQGVNENPATMNYTQARQIVENLRLNLLRSEASLAAITDPDVTLLLHFGLIRLDLNGDGRLDDKEYLWKIYAHASNNYAIEEAKAADFYIKFDRGDVHWLQGYCHLLLALCETYLAYDTRELFERTGHLFFSRVDSPYNKLQTSKHLGNVPHSDLDVLDAIAFIHLIHCPLSAPEKMEAALHHLEVVVAQSRISWKWIMLEVDDDHEWLPNPKQTGVIPGVRVTDEMVTTWARIMDEAEKLLAGKLLLPFWRGAEGRGINLRRVFLEPRLFDLVLWVQGSDALPYLEQGETTKGADWREWTRTFGGNFPGFAIWFN